MVTTYQPLVINRALRASLRSVETGGVKKDAARQLLGELLQSALELEFATVPPYLAAAFSLDARNERVQQLILRIAREEMLHMTAVANMMNAIGCAPNIVAAVPEYPHDVTTLEPPLRLDLRSFSVELVEEVLMRIEAPEHPVQFPSAAEAPTTIGQFYASIIKIISEDTIPGLFGSAERNAYKQIPVAPNFTRFAYAHNQDGQPYALKPEIDFLIKDKQTAVRHLEWIVDQGEGAKPLDPLTAEGIPGHYYRLDSIRKSRYLVPDDTVEQKYSFKGADLLFDPVGVHEFDVNPKLADYSAHPRVARQMKRFNEIYTGMINALQVAFNCPGPDERAAASAAYEDAIGKMRQMTNIASAIVQTAGEAGIKAGMPFQYFR